jgi:chromosome segregation ATPase
VASLEAERDGLHRSVSEAEQARQQLQAELGRLVGASADLSSGLAAAELLFDRVEASVNSIGVVLADCRSQIRQLEAGARDHCRRVAELETELDARGKAAEAAASECRKLTALAKKLGHEREELKGQVRSRLACLARFCFGGLLLCLSAFRFFSSWKLRERMAARDESGAMPLGEDGGLVDGNQKQDIAVKEAQEKYRIAFEEVVALCQPIILRSVLGIA